MKEINIAKKLVTKRREKGLTQEDIAVYIGVSKASVSKWETGQSYPDITFLPQLAAYFNISIDELMGYEPQMNKEDIKKMYHRLSSSFANIPFDLVLAECRDLIKKYYSCFPLLVQMVILLINHHMLAEEKKEQEEILNEVVELCVRIRTESDDIWIVKEATSLESACYLMLEQPQNVLNVLGEAIRPMSTDYEYIGQAYQMLGNISKAKEVTQINMFQHLLSLTGATPDYLMLNADNINKIEEILHRTCSIAEVYDLERLHPNSMLKVYFTAAQVYSLNMKSENALDMLQKYVDVCTINFSNFSLHGDNFFDLIDGWFADFDLGTNVLRNERVIKESMLEIVISNPKFEFLKGHPRYKNIIAILKANIVDKKVN